MTQDKGRGGHSPVPTRPAAGQPSVLCLQSSEGVDNPPAHSVGTSLSVLGPLTTVFRKGSVLAFDFGLKRIGVAVGEWETRTAHPLTTITEIANAARFAQIGALIAEWRPVELVVGLPLTLAGEPHELTRRCQRFANQLAGRFGLPVRLVDERLTSVEAEARLAEAGVHARRAREAIDSVAAQQILHDYFARV